MFQGNKQLNQIFLASVTFNGGQNFPISVSDFKIDKLFGITLHQSWLQFTQQLSGQSNIV